MKPIPKGGISGVLRKQQDNLCFYCGNEMTDTAYSTENRRGFTKDHFFASSWFGGHGNLVMACRGCNGGKRAKTPCLSQCLRFYRVWEGSGLLVMLFSGWHDFMDTQRYIDRLNYLVGPLEGVVIEYDLCYNVLSRILQGTKHDFGTVHQV